MKIALEKEGVPTVAAWELYFNFEQLSSRTLSEEIGVFWDDILNEKDKKRRNGYNYQWGRA